MKMRRLIPAMAMLLVSAVMLSTATFAWFTTNEAVTASGMQVQAKATGSLVISTTPLTFTSTSTDADLASAVTQLKPIHLIKKDDAGEWQAPGNAKAVDPITGKMDASDALTPVDISANVGEYYFDNVVYIGSAGDPMDQKDLAISLTAPVIATGTDTVTQAYSVAVYVMGVVTGEADTLGMPAWNTKPNAIAHVDPTNDNNKDTIDIKVNVPSIVSAGDQNNNVTGLKVVIRVFVDGDLDAPSTSTVQVPDGTYNYESATGKTYSANAQYFVADGSGYKLAVIPTDYVSGTTEITEAWYTRTANTVASTYKFVNSKNVPTAASSLQVEFSLVG